MAKVSTTQVANSQCLDSCSRKRASARIEERLSYIDTSQYGNRCHLRNMTYAGRRLPVQEHHGASVLKWHKKPRLFM